MPQNQDTQVTPMRIRTRRLFPETSEPQVIPVDPPKKRFGEDFLKNLAVAAALVLCAVTLRTGAVPSLQGAADVIMTAATDDSLLDDDLGKLSFVSTLFPEAVLVFGQSKSALSMPVSGGTVVHAWSESEPWMSWRTGSMQVKAAGSGEVIGIYHGNGEERLVQVMGHDGLACLYGNLEHVLVSTGDAVETGDVLGTLLPEADAVFEVRRDGMSIDPALYLGR